MHGRWDGGAYDLDICDGFDPPVYCSNPCNTDFADSLLNHKHIMMGIEQMWVDSGYGTYNQMEQGAFIGVDPNTGEVFMRRVKTGDSGMLALQTACELEFKAINQETRDAIQAQGIKFFIHTHPWSNLERQDACGRPDLTYISSKVNENDKKISGKMGIPGIFIDNNNMVMYDQGGKIRSILPCGYKQVNKEISL
jgi:hypothetical protein